MPSRRYAVLLLLGMSFTTATAWAGDADVQLTTTDGSTTFTIKNSNGIEVSSFTSKGDAYLRSAVLGNPLPVSCGGTGSTDPSVALNNLGAEPADSTLQSLASYDANGFIAQTSSDTFTSRALTAGSDKVLITNGDGINGNPSIDISVHYARTTADQTTTGTSASDLNDLTFPIGANETWSFEFFLQTGCSSTGGIKFALTTPAGADFRAVADGVSSSATGRTAAVITASGALSAAFNKVAITTGYVRIWGVVTNGATTGNVQLQFASNTSGQTSTVFNNSYLMAREF